jgi:hypothetical protein
LLLIRTDSPAWTVPITVTVLGITVYELPEDELGWLKARLVGVGGVRALGDSPKMVPWLLEPSPLLVVP